MSNPSLHFFWFAAIGLWFSDHWLSALGWALLLVFWSLHALKDARTDREMRAQALAHIDNDLAAVRRRISAGVEGEQA